MPQSKYSGCNQDFFSVFISVEAILFFIIMIPPFLAFSIADFGGQTRGKL